MNKYNGYERQYENLDKELNRVKRLQTNLTSGYLGYDLLYDLGPINEIDDRNDVIFKDKLRDILSKLSDVKSYTLLVVIKYLNDFGDTSGYTIGNSYKVNKFTHIDLLSQRMMSDYNLTKLKYNLEEEDGDLIIMGKEWLSDDEFKVSKDELTKLYNDLLKEKPRQVKHRNVYEIKKDLMNYVDYFDKYNKILMNDYGTLLGLRYLSSKGEVIIDKNSVINCDGRRFYRNGDLILEVVNENVNKELKFDWLHHKEVKEIRIVNVWNIDALKGEGIYDDKIDVLNNEGDKLTKLLKMS